MFSGVVLYSGPCANHQCGYLKSPQHSLAAVRPITAFCHGPPREVVVENCTTVLNMCIHSAIGNNRKEREIGMKYKRENVTSPLFTWTK